jgi:hypothetical protein
MPLILLQESETTANLTSGFDLVNELQAPTVPTRFGVAAQFSGLGNSSGNMELHVEVLTTGNVSYATHVVTATRAVTAGSPNRGRIEFDKLFLLPVGYKAQFKIKSLTANDTSVNTTVYVYDPNYPTVDAEFRDSEGVPSQSAAGYGIGDAIGAEITFSVGANRGSIVACRVLDKNKNTVPLELWLLRSSIAPTLSNDWDNDPFPAAGTSLASLAGVVRIDDWFVNNEDSIGQATNLPLSFTDLTSGTLRAWLVSRGTPTYASTTDLTVQLEVLKD